jgi:hypothetical protein
MPREYFTASPVLVRNCGGRKEEPYARANLVLARQLSPSLLHAKRTSPGREISRKITFL